MFRDLGDLDGDIEGDVEGLGLLDNRSDVVILGDYQYPWRYFKR